MASFTEARICGNCLNEIAFTDPVADFFVDLDALFAQLFLEKVFLFGRK
jgi:hypothetical protein